MSSTLRWSRAAAVGRLSHGAASRRTNSSDSVGAPLRRFRHLDTYRKSVAQVFEMGDDQDLFKLGLDRLNRFDDAIAALLVLRAEALVDDERLQPRAGTMSQEPGERDANGEVHAKAFTAAEHLVAARA